MMLTLLVNRQHPRDTRHPLHRHERRFRLLRQQHLEACASMTEDATLGTVLELATADTADSEDYQAVLLQRGTADSYDRLY